MTDTDRAHVRLAELVAALSLGIDLGFGQPMEHVLRQCLIALRLAERMGLDEQTRAVVYYTALLVNVGCHSDAHEQAKWFGDDIALKSGKYDYELRSVRGMAAGMKLLGSNHPPLHRFRVGLEFAISGHREVDDMISHHAAIARSLGEQLELPAEVLDALGGAYEMWDGRGWPGKLKGDEVPVASRVAMLAEYVEVAHRVGGVDAARALIRKRSGGQFDPAFAEVMDRDADEILSGLDAIATWEAVVGAEPALAIVLSGDRFDAALGAIANFVDLKTPYTLGHAQAVAELVASAARAARPVRGRGPHAAARGTGPRPRPARRVELDLGQAGPTWRRRMGASAVFPLHHRAHAVPVAGAGAARGDRRPAPRAARRLRVSARPVWVGDLAVGAGAGGGGRLSGDARAATVPRRRRGA